MSLLSGLYKQTVRLCNEFTENYVLRPLNNKPNLQIVRETLVDTMFDFGMIAGTLSLIAPHANKTDWPLNLSDANWFVFMPAHQRMFNFSKLIPIDTAVKMISTSIVALNGLKLFAFADEG